jgi:hypothetical protein
MALAGALAATRIVADAAVADSVASRSDLPHSASFLAERGLAPDAIRLTLHSLRDFNANDSFGSGSLVYVSASTEWDVIKALLLTELYGDSLDLSRINFQHVRLFLLPDGEFVHGPGEPSP